MPKLPVGHAKADALDLAFETKSGVVRALWDVLLRGPVDRPVAAQPWYREVIEERDPQRRLQLNARNSREGIGALLQVIRSAAPLGCRHRGAVGPHPG